MSNNEHRDNNSDTWEDLHDDELNQAFLSLRKQLLRVTKEKQELIQEIDQLKNENKCLKRMIGNGANALAATVTALPEPEQEASPGSKMVVPKHVKLTSSAKIPNYKVIPFEIFVRDRPQKTSAEGSKCLAMTTCSVAEIVTFSPSFANKTVNFSFGPGQPGRKLNLAFEYTTDYCTNTYKLNMATIYTETEDMACLDKCDYFIHICAVNEGSEPTDSSDQCWFKITTNSKIVKSSTGRVTLYMDNSAIQIKSGEGGFQSFQAKKDATHHLDIIVSMSLFLYASTTSEKSTSTSTLSASREGRIAKLLDFKSQRRPTANIRVVVGHAGGFQVKRSIVSPTLSIAERTLLDSGSPIFTADFKSASPLYRAGLHCSVTQTSIDAFSNWVYGIDTKAFAYDIQLNMEVLHFAHEFWICDLIKFCIDNMCQILEKNFTLELLVKVWQFEEHCKIRNLDECLREVIKTKAKMNFDIEESLSWKE